MRGCFWSGLPESNRLTPGGSRGPRLVAAKPPGIGRGQEKERGADWQDPRDSSYVTL